MDVPIAVAAVNVKIISHVVALKVILYSVWFITKV